MKYISAIILAWTFGIQAFAQTAPTINPLATFWGENGEEQSNNYSGSAPLRARFEANTEHADGWTAYYEWRFSYERENKPYLIRYEENTSYTFSRSGHHSVVNVPGSDDWYIVYHRINKNYLHNGPGTHREVCVDKLTFDESGHINKVAPTRKGIDPVDMDDFIRQITDVNTINNADATAVSIAYYTVDGIKLGSSEPDKAGLYIRRELLSNGLVRSFKMLK